MMKQQLTVYHGSQQIVAEPKYGIGKTYNDYGRGFYCTEDVELAKEWACPIPNNGFANKYRIDVSDLNVMHLRRGGYGILNWLAILLKNDIFVLDIIREDMSNDDPRLQSAVSL